MKVFDLYNYYFKKSGFLTPINDFLAKEDLTFEQEKLILRLTIELQNVLM